LIAGAAICTVNLAEVVTVLIRGGVPEIEIRQTLHRLPMLALDFDNELALAGGLMSSVTRRMGLSVGDRACLALARRQNKPALTTDRAWVEAGPG
jgi:PIN domain nuclease of toxin-antitoxin system